ncbi:MAG: hypothetical protein Q7T86_03310 [Hyphomicrobiaceae bacterium]|nr:hypothetical protein [Hyphomicrobiaceae bacterium]
MAVPLDQQISAIEGAINGEIFDKDALKAAALTIGVLQRDPVAAKAFFRFLLSPETVSAVFREFPEARVVSVT